MKIANDIRSLIEDDTKRLAEAFITGEIAITGSDQFRWSLFTLASEIIRFQVENRTLSTLIPVLGTMKWLSLDEACIYARKSRNTMLELIRQIKIYGTKADSGEWTIDRETIDAYYNEERLALQEKLKKLRRAS